MSCTFGFFDLESGAFVQSLLSRPPRTVIIMSSPRKSGKSKKAGKSSSRSAKAGITFPVGRVATLLRKGKYASRFGRAAPVFVAAVLEYLTAELVQASAAALKDAGKKRLTPRYINLGIRADEEFSNLLSGAVISGGGVLPHINKVLLKTKKSKKGKKKSKKVKKVKAPKVKKAKSSKKKSSKKKKSGKKAKKSKAKKSKKSKSPKKKSKSPKK